MGNTTDYSIVYEKYSNALLASSILTLFGAAVGIIGNFIIIVIYYFRIKDKSERYFIPVLAAMDLTACIINGYGNTVLNTYMFDFSGEFHCRVIWFLELFISGFSGHMVLIIALQRYLLICKPFGPHMTLFWKRFAVLVTLLATTLYAAPSLAMSGIKSTDRVFLSRNITTRMCVFVVDYTGAAITYSAILLFLTVTNAIVCMALYLPIIKVIHSSFSTSQTCKTILPFCGKRDNTISDIENSISSNFDGKHRVWLNDILKEMQTDDALETVGNSRTDLISLDDYSEKNVRDTVLERNGDICGNGKQNDGANISVIGITVIDQRRDNNLCSPRDNEIGAFVDQIEADEDIQNNKHKDSNKSSTHCSAGSSNEKDKCENKITKQITPSSSTAKNETDDIADGKNDTLYSQKSPGQRKTWTFRNGMKLFRSSSKLERMKTTMNVMFLTIIVVY
ncbi:uncharacterized protein LOC134257202, partial [Saccostrea cucullata]|uniref:uncharacterized protein LOC134257202 n=1 Tax=Saccostrea cuccullata TaxID=36930 RepID=UPI002ED0C655